jgi:hypothetical protein
MSEGQWAIVDETPAPCRAGPCRIFSNAGCQRRKCFEKRHPSRWPTKHIPCIAGTSGFQRGSRMFPYIVSFFAMAVSALSAITLITAANHFDRAN